MTSFQSQPPRPRACFSRPAYPRLLGLGILALTAACSGAVTDPASSDDGTGGTAATAGVPSVPYDAAVDSTGGTGGTGGSGGIGGYGAQPGGTGGMAYDAEVPREDAGPEAEPPPDGDIAPPWDAGTEGWDAEVVPDPPDADMAGGEPAPYYGK